MMKKDDTLSDEYIDNTIRGAEEGIGHPPEDLLCAMREIRTRRDAERPAVPGSYPKTPEKCAHGDFHFQIEVARVLGDESGEVEYFNVHLRMTCKECGLPFTFQGLPRGIDLSEPMAGVMGIEARLPVRPLREEDKQSETMRIVVPPRGGGAR